MDGIINLNKPTGITSAKALYRVRSITGERKSGHAGTLDPAAAGVLVLCLGKATKLVESIMDQPKVYRATARLDVTSESFDCDRPLRPVTIATIPTRDAVRDACEAFEGTIEQTPPQISAVKVGGVPAYKRRAAEGPVALAARPVIIYWLHIHAYTWPTIDFEMCCGRGTYVRSLIRDLGERLGVGGCLTALTRTRVGPFAVEDAWSMEALCNAAAASKYLFDLDRARTALSRDAVTIPPRPAVCA
ncbi:MAG: tRNA pseudouridine(55) synthase TruB [Planctomycetota bacterium]